MAGGHACVPMLFNVDESGQISFVNKLEEDKKAENSSKFSAKVFFSNRDKLGVSDMADTTLNTTHQNQVIFYFFNKSNSLALKKSLLECHDLNFLGDFNTLFYLR